MFVSGAAVAISCFNMVMCVENEFDPVLLEAALQKRRSEVKEREAIEQRRQEFLKRAQTRTSRSAMKEAFLSKLMQYAGTEDQKMLVDAQKDQNGIN